METSLIFDNLSDDNLSDDNLSGLIFFSFFFFLLFSLGWVSRGGRRISSTGKTKQSDERGKSESIDEQACKRKR